MKRLVGSFLVAVFLHGLVGYVLSSHDFSEVKLNVQSGVTSVQMTFQSPVSAREKVDETEPEKTESPSPEPEREPEEEPEEQPEPDQAEFDQKKEEVNKTKTEKPSEKEGDRPSEQTKEATEESPTDEKTPSNETQKEPPPPEPREEPETTEPEPRETEEEPKKESQKKLEPKETEEKPKKQEDAPETPEDAEKKVLRESARSEGVKWKEDVEYLQKSRIEYPTRARIRGIEGRVKLLVTIDKNGDPTEVFIHESSGSHVLDRTAKIGVEAWTFNPAQKNGETVTSRTIVPVRFQLD